MNAATDGSDVCENGTDDDGGMYRYRWIEAGVQQIRNSVRIKC